MQRRGKWSRNGCEQAGEKVLARQVRIDECSFDELKQRPQSTGYWRGVRNYQARNLIRDDMKKGDLAFFYHSNCDEPGIAGIAAITRAGYPDPSQFDDQHHYYDEKSTEDEPRWFPST